MSVLSSMGRVMLSSAFATSVVTVTLAAALAVSPTALAQGQRAVSQAKPLDRSDLGRSKQDPNLKTIPVPPTVTTVEKLPVSKIQLPKGFSAEVWAHSMPGARTMVMGPKGTMFVGTRSIGRVYAVVDKGGSREQRK